MTSWVPFDLLDHLWQSTLFSAAVWLVARAVRANAARVRYWLWFTASAKFLVPISMLVSFGERFAWRTAPAAPPPVMSVIEQLLTPAATTIATTPAAAPTASSTAVWPILLLVAWAVGVLLVFAQWWLQWLPIRRALRDARPIDVGENMGLTILASASMVEPGVFGIWRPVLLVPEDIPDRLTPAQLRALIAHERCHVNHHDNLTAALHMAVEALFWFHPVVWWLERRLIEERERACDEYVLRSGSSPHDYAEGILEVCRFAKQPPPVYVAGVGGSDLTRRIRMILRQEIGRPLGFVRVGALCLCAAAAGGGPVVVGASAPQANRDTGGITDAAFAVASIKRNLSGSAALTVPDSPPGQVVMINAPIAALVTRAYPTPMGVRGVIGLPSWAETERFDVEARTTPLATRDDLTQMWRALLSSRMQLAARYESREQPSYDLVLARRDGRLGPKLVPSTLDCRRSAPPPGGEAPTPEGAATRCGVLATPIGIASGSISLPGLAFLLRAPLERPVVDRTGLTGAYSVDLRYAPPGPPLADTDALHVFTALQDQLGLKVEPSRTTVQVVVVAHIERPSEN